MPKHIIDNFIGGLSLSDRQGPAGSYDVGTDVDPHRKLGYIMPGYTYTTLTDSATIDAITTSNCIKGGAYAYVGGVGKLHRITLATNAVSKTNPWPYSMPASGDSLRWLSLYTCKKSADSSNADRLFFAYIDASADTATGALEIGMYDLDNTTFDPDWLSTTPTNAALLGSALNTKALTDFPMVVWNSYLWIACENTVSRLDGQADTNGALTVDKLTLEEGYYIQSIFTTPNYLGICANWRGVGTTTSLSEGRGGVFLWDGTSSTFNKFIPVEDDITGSIRYNNNIYLFTSGKESGYLRRLTDNGSEIVKKLQTYDSSGTAVPITGSPVQRELDIFQGKLLNSAGLNKGYVFSYGRPQPEYPMALTHPSTTTEATWYDIVLTTVSADKYYIFGRNVANTVRAARVVNTSGYSTNALWKGLYKDFGQKIRVNYVKFYFDTLVESDSVTVALETDYGTANALGTITHTTDGATITSKRFNLKKDCHSFRPTIDWTAGGVAFSKIVVDFDYVSDI